MWTAKILSYTVSIDQREKMDLRIMSLKKIIKVPDGIDPTTVKSRVIKNLKRGSVLFLEGDRILEEKAKQDDGRFVVKLDLRRRPRFLFFTWLQPSRFVAWWRRPWFSDVTTLQRRLANHRSVTCQLCYQRNETWKSPWTLMSKNLKTRPNKYQVVIQKNRTTTEWTMLAAVL